MPQRENSSTLSSSTQIDADHRPPVDARPTWASIDLAALAHNFDTVRRAVGDAVETVAVVKANAYGHGVVRCAEALRDAGARWFCVAIAEEAAELRRAALTDERILCLEGVWGEQAAWCVAERVTPVVFHLDAAEAVSRAAAERGVTADVHVKIDTGMNRLGVRHDQVSEFARALSELPNIRVEGVMTHFASADEPAQNEFTNAQIERFEIALEAMRAAGHRPTFQDLCNSAGLFAHARARGNMVRPGGVLYGLVRDVLAPSDVLPDLRPVMSWHTSVALLKEVPAGETLGYGRTFRTTRPTLIATLPVGYNDGFARSLSNRGRVILHGRYAPVVGRVSMDLTMIDVTEVAREISVREGDLVTLIGRQGAAELTAEDVAADAGTISYEITCGISNRVPRSYEAK